MANVLVIIEHDGRSVDDTAFELATAARQIAGDAGMVTALLAGSAVSGLGSALNGWFDIVRVLDDASLEVPDGDRLADVFVPVVERESPHLVLAPHTNNTMDFVPALAVRLGRPLLTDCLSISVDDGSLSGVRPAYGGKVLVRVRAAKSDRGYLATLRPGAVKSGDFPGRDTRTIEDNVQPATSTRRRFVRTVAGNGADIDIAQAERLVAVGRGIEDEDGLDLIRGLADALGAEVACSRPVVDKQWLPKSRQVGTSGKSVRPKLYVAVGISGSFQHIGGIKGDPFLVAINKDPRAPIFAVADVGIVGDLFEVVPLLEEKIRALKR